MHHKFQMIQNNFDRKISRAQHNEHGFCKTAVPAGTGYNNIISEVCPLYLCMPKVQWEDHCLKKCPCG